MYRSRSLRIGLAGLAAVLALGASSTSFAVTKYWVASGGAKLWSTAANWSPSGVPGMTDDVILSNTMSNNDVIIDLNVDIASLTVQNGYAKDIGPSGSQTIRIRGNMSYAGAAGFSLTASVAQIDGSLTVTSGELRAGAGTLMIGGDVTLADQLTASSGPVTIGGTLTMSGSAGRYEAGSGTLTVGAMALSGGQFNGNSSATGTVTVTGNVTVSGTHTFTANSNAAATIRIGGNYSQGGTSTFSGWPLRGRSPGISRCRGESSPHRAGSRPWRFVLEDGGDVRRQRRDCHLRSARDAVEQSHAGQLDVRDRQGQRRSGRLLEHGRGRRHDRHRLRDGC